METVTLGKLNKKDKCHVFSHLGIHVYVHINIYILMCVYVCGMKVDGKLSRKQEELMGRGIRGRQRDMRSGFKCY